jgi:multiple sugar transport system permease protein
MMGYPLVNNIYLAFTYNRLLIPSLSGFAGWDNFRSIIGSSDIGQFVVNTICWVVFSVGFQFLLGLGLAMALRNPFKGRGLYQSIVFLPWALSSSIVGLAFRWIFNGEFGPLMDLLLKSSFNPFGLRDFLAANRSFLGVPGLSLAVVIFSMVWIGIPFFGIMLLAALQSIPSELYEAGDIDGTNALQRFVYITMPSIKPTIIMTILLRVIWVFNSPDLIYTITGGGPGNSSQTLTSFLYMTANKSLDFGMTAALGLMFMVVLVLFALFFIKVTGYEEASGA